MKKTGLKNSTETLSSIRTGITTRSIEARVYFIRQDPRCREGSHTVQYIMVVCRMQIGRAYTEGYNLVSGIGYRYTWARTCISLDGQSHRRLWKIKGLRSCEISRSRQTGNYWPIKQTF